MDGNARYTVGWGLRGDPSFPPPIDQLCFNTRWVIRTAAGVETNGPLGGSPTAINAFDVAVGTVESLGGPISRAHRADAGAARGRLGAQHRRHRHQ